MGDDNDTPLVRGVTEVGVQQDAHDGTCSKDGCLANAGGPCAEGNDDRFDCPFYELTEVDEPVPAEPQIRRVSLQDGEALRADELERVLRSHPTSVIVPLGRVGAGKTTLISVIYHLVRSRRLARWKFTGSETVIGFARRAHHASFASDRETPITPRTEKEESGLHLHLGMRRVGDDARCPIVLVDLSGEHVNAFANGESIAVIEKALARADHIPVVIDGGQIGNSGSRPLAVMEARTLLKMLEKHKLRDNAKVCVVVTKGDLLVGHDLTETVNAIVRGTVAQDSTFFVTADRPSIDKDGDGEPIVSLGDGIDEFVSHVARRSESTRPNEIQAHRPRPSTVLQRMWAQQ